MASKLKAGEVIEYGGLEWTVLDVEQDKVLVLAKESIGNMPFDKRSSNDFLSSTLCAYLNGEFVKVLESNGADTAAIVPAEDGANVFLLTAEQYEAYKALIPALSEYRWLRSPGCYPNFAAIVYPDGSVSRYGLGVNIGYIVVRPALWLKHEAVQGKK